MSADRKDVFIDQAAVQAVDRKIRESTAFTRGVMSSWANPMDGVMSGPMGKITVPPKLVDVPHGTPGNPNISARTAIPSPKEDFVVIPMQGMKAFKKLVEKSFELEVRLTQDQAKMLLDMLQAMPTPKKMFDAKPIFALMDSLARKIEGH